MSKTAINNYERVIFAPLKWEGSIVIWLSLLLSNILLCINFTVLFDLVWIKLFKKETFLAVPELNILFQLCAQVTFLYHYHGNRMSLIIAIYILVDILGIAMRDLIIAPQIHRDDEGGFILIRHRRRWLLLAFSNAIQIVASFAMIFLYYGKQFEPYIKDPVTAIYQSALTFSTLGYGEIKPICTEGKIIVSIELFYFLFFLVGKLPTAVSVIRIRRKHG